MSKTRVCSRCGQRRSAKAYATPRARVCTRCKRLGSRRASRALRIRQTYGITLAEYDAILAEQGGVCAGCGGKRRYHLHVDHCHKTGRERGVRQSVRGLLCARCNKLLRDSRDGAAILRRLADYLEDWPARRVIDAHRKVGA